MSAVSAPQSNAEIADAMDRQEQALLDGLQARITPQRLREVQDIAMEVAVIPAHERPAYVTKLGFADPAEHIYVLRLAQEFDRGRNFLIHKDYVDPLAADGQIDAADRRTLSAARSWQTPRVFAGERVGDAGLFDIAWDRARLFRAIYEETVRAGVVRGVSPTAPQHAPSRTAVQGLLDDSLLARIGERSRTAATELVARHRSPWQSLASDVRRNWERNPDLATSAQRMVHALFLNERGDRIISDSNERARLATAIVSRLSDQQLRSLDVQTAAALMAGVRGGGEAHSREGMSDHEQSAGVVLRYRAGGPRGFNVFSGNATTDTTQLRRLESAIAGRFDQDDTGLGYPIFSERR